MPPTTKAILAAACLSLVAPVFAQSTTEANLPLWEAGIGAFAVTTPAYPGADDRNGRVLALPYLLYRGEVLRADQSGVGARLFRSDRLEFDIGLAGALPSDSDDVQAREGMPDLGTLFEFGPRLKIKLADLTPTSRLRAELPLRAVIEARGGLRRQGWTFEPRLAYEMRGLPGRAAAPYAFEANASLVFGDKRLNRYFYEVAPQYATATRQAYQADAGLVLARVGLFATRQMNPDLRLFGFVRYESYAGSANNDSPLHQKNSGASAGIGFAWTLARSNRSAARYEPIDPVTP
jgi:outer membrane protein